MFLFQQDSHHARVWEIRITRHSTEGITITWVHACTPSCKPTLVTTPTSSISTFRSVARMLSFTLILKMFEFYFLKDDNLIWSLVLGNFLDVVVVCDVIKHSNRLKTKTEEATLQFPGSNRLLSTSVSSVQTSGKAEKSL